LRELYGANISRYYYILFSKFLQELFLQKLFFQNSRDSRNLIPTEINSLMYIAISYDIQELKFIAKVSNLFWALVLQF